MPTKSVKPESEMTTDEFIASLQEDRKAKEVDKPSTIRDNMKKAKKPGVIDNYFYKRKKIMEELDK